MNWITFFYVGVASTILTIAWQLLFRVYPVWKEVKIERARSVLAKSLTAFNHGALLEMKICDGHYLHDKYYKFLFTVLTHGVRLRFRMLTTIKHDEKAEHELQIFRKEIISLDERTQKVIADASFAVGKILLLRNPFVFVAAYALIRGKRKSFRSKMLAVTATAEYITITAGENDYNLLPSAA